MYSIICVAFVVLSLQVARLAWHVWWSLEPQDYIQLRTVRITPRKESVCN